LVRKVLLDLGYIREDSPTKVVRMTAKKEKKLSSRKS